jgi:hypothetical protein
MDRTMRKAITILAVISSSLVIGCSKPDFSENLYGSVKKIERQLSVLEARIDRLDKRLQLYTLADEKLYESVTDLATVLKGAILAEEMKIEGKMK